MSDLKSNEILQAEEFIKEGRTQEALEIVKKFQQTAWPYFFRFETDKALGIALQSKELIEKVGEEIDFARNFLLLGWTYNQKGDFDSSLTFGIKSAGLHEKLNSKVGLASSLYLIGTNDIDNYYKTSQVAELNDIPLIENLIKDIFIT